MEILRNPHYDFLGKTKILLALSTTLIVGGVAYIATHGVQYGVEFSGGTQLILRFQSRPDQDRVRSAVDKVASGATIQTYDDPSKNQVLVRLPHTGPENAAQTDLSSGAQSVLGSLKANYSQDPVLESSTEVVGPIVGAELRRKAIQITIFGLVFQLVYIAFRFGGAVWGTAAVVAVFHDVLITLGLIVLFHYEITLNVIAALLTLVGYSQNDTIVIFDRVRENLKQRRKEPLAKVINDSINQTLSRTIISSGTTFLTVLALLLFGGEVLRGFAFTMVIGIIVGTYSTIYIASPIVVWWDHFRHDKQQQQKPPAARAAL
jgi:preprotein translocase subunit SecF